MKKLLTTLILVLCLLFGAVLSVYAAEAPVDTSSQPSSENTSENASDPSGEEALPLAFSLKVSAENKAPADALHIGEGDVLTVHLYADAQALADADLVLRFSKENFAFASAEYTTYDGMILTSASEQSDGSILLSCDVAENASLSAKSEIAKLQFNTLGKTNETAHSFGLFTRDNQAVGTPVSVTISHRHAFGNWTNVSVSADGKTQTQKGVCIHCQKTATREIPVRNYAIIIKEGADKIKWDTESKVFYALPDNLTVQQLLNKLQTEGNMIVLNKDGSEAAATDKIKTGMVVCVLGIDDVEPAEEYRATISVWGDADGDGRITVADARFALRCSVGLEKEISPQAKLAMKCTDGAAITPSDARMLLRISVGLDFFYPIPATGITLNKTAVTLYTGKSETVTATVTPENASFRNASWSSSDNSVATVANGRITGKKGGKAVITATNRSGQKAQCTVTVIQAVETVTAKQNSFYLPAGKKIDISKVYSFTPSDAVVTPVVWKSSNSAFTVENGVISCATAYDKMTNKITDISVTFPGGYTHKFRVTLIPANASYCQFTYDKLTLVKGMEFWLSAVLSKDAKLNIVSDNTAVLKVDNAAKRIKAVGVGTAKLTCSGVNYTTTCTVTVTSDSVRFNTFTPLTDTQDLALTLTNHSGQKITRMDIYLQGLNSTGKVLSDETRICRIENIPKDAKNRPYNWNRRSIWTNAAVADAKIEKMILTFEDGHMETVKGEYVTFG